MSDRTSIYPTKTQEKIFLILALLVAVTLPLSIRLNSLSIILLFVHWTLEGNWREKWQRLVHNTFSLIFIAIYLYCIIALVYTSNMRQGTFELEKKISFLVFPLILSTTRHLNKTSAEKILIGFVVACLAASIFCLGYAYYSYLLDANPAHFFYHDFSQETPLGIHAIYFSLYIAVCIFILVYFLQSNWRELRTSTRVYTVLLAFFFVIILMLLSSKTIIFAFFLMMLFFVARLTFKTKGFALGSISLFSGLILFVMVILFVPYVRGRFDEVLIDNYDQTNVLRLDDYQGYHFTGGNVRLAIWKMLVLEVNRENAWLFGVSPGDAQDVLTATFIAKHVYPGDGINIDYTTYNAHNQFLQFLISLGLLGVFLFAALLYLLLRKSIQDRDAILFFVVVMFISFSLTEATLQTQKGIVFLAFFSTLLMNTRNVFEGVNLGMKSEKHRPQ
jgi:O-antigen ligase